MGCKTQYRITLSAGNGHYEITRSIGFVMVDTPLARFDNDLISNSVFISGGTGKVEQIEVKTKKFRGALLI